MFFFVMNNSFYVTYISINRESFINYYYCDSKTQHSGFQSKKKPLKKFKKNPKKSNAFAYRRKTRE